MYNALSKFTQSLLADNFGTRFPNYTKSYHPMKILNTVGEPQTSNLNIILQRLFGTMIK